jgi:membrane associated rhomboid family serine protease
MNNFFIDRNTQKFSAISFLLTITVAIWVFGALVQTAESYFLQYGALLPSAVFHGQIWRLLSYAFLHDPNSLFHIAFNMLGLWMFGKEIEYMWGNRRFFEFYFFSAIFAGLFSLLNVFLFKYGTIIIGASGALMALLVVYAYYFPNRQLLFFFFIPMKVKTAVIVYAIISVFGTANNYGGVSHITHFGGLIAGFLWIHIGDKFDLIVRNISAAFQNISTAKSETEYKIQTPQTSVRAEEVDKILDKINQFGIHSLTPAERKILQDASADYKNER